MASFICMAPSRTDVPGRTNPHLLAPAQVKSLHLIIKIMMSMTILVLQLLCFLTIPQCLFLLHEVWSPHLLTALTGPPAANRSSNLYLNRPGMLVLLAFQ